jgi:hypothetical protein
MPRIAIQRLGSIDGDRFDNGQHFFRRNFLKELARVARDGWSRDPSDNSNGKGYCNAIRRGINEVFG